MGRRIALDTNIFLYALRNKNDQEVRAHNIIGSLGKAGVKAYTSVLTIHELLTGLRKRGLEKKISEYLEYVKAGGLITLVEYNKQTALISALVRAKYGLKTPDAIHIACALQVKAKKFITTDRRFPKVVENLQIEVLK